MKAKIFSFIPLLLAVLLAGCGEYDNFEPPKSTLTGKVVYNGQPVGVRSGTVRLELRQPGPEYPIWKANKIDVHVAQDGSFSAVLFDGNYKLTRVPGNGPWASQTDTINVEVRGGATVEVPVEPFFVIKNESFEKNGNAINSTFSLQRGNTSRNLERVNLYLSSTTIVDATKQSANGEKLAAAVTDLSQPVSLSVNIPSSLAGKPYIYARVGVKTAGIEELAYSAPQKIMLK
jgi:Protein of unknown function (DUF3823) N-terminal domain/Domain of unknown function (DUF3823_C)